MGRIRGARLRSGVALVVAITALAACGDDGKQESDGPEQDVNASVFTVGYRLDGDAEGSPTAGGSFTFGEWVQPPTLDPAKYFISGAIGGMEYAAIYDPLVRFDPETGEYSPQMAEAVESNDDFTTWTVSLRDGVMFTDGTRFDSAAVKFNVERLVSENASNGDLITEYIADIDDSDPSTVVFTLTKPWPGFQFLLASNVGYIGSPTAIQEDPEGFGVAPVGAGAFMLKSFVPAESIELVANPDYWNGKPALESVKIVPINGDSDRLEQLKNGDVDGAFFRDFENSQKAIEAGFPGYMNLSNGGWTMAINNAEGRPGSDVRVRQAIQYATDPQIVNDRFLGSYGVAGSDLFLPWSRWASDVKGLPFDQAKAKELLAEAKSDGFDGKLTIAYSPQGENFALAEQAMLNAVGFEVDLDPIATTPDYQTKVYVDKDFDLAPAAMDMGDGGVAQILRNTFFGARAYLGITDRLDEWEVLINELWSATTDEERAEITKKVQTLWNETVPQVTVSALAKYNAWDKSIHGLKPTIDDIMLIDGAWRDS